MTHAQISQTLFVTPKTGETHLYNIPQKLDITSGRALAGRLSA